jgi:hypothetical protein
MNCDGVSFQWGAGAEERLGVRIVRGPDVSPLRVEDGQ